MKYSAILALIGVSTQINLQATLEQPTELAEEELDQEMNEVNGEALDEMNQELAEEDDEELPDDADEDQEGQDLAE